MYHPTKGGKVAMTTIAHFDHDRPRVIVGVDTHRDVHVCVALDHLGRRIGEKQIPTTKSGYCDLRRWAESFGEIESFGIEGTSCYGAGLSRWLIGEGFTVFEVVRANRQARRRKGKSDPIDAESPARAVLAGDAKGLAKAGDNHVEMIRTLRVARSGAIKARTQAINSMRALIVTSPVELRDQFRSLSPILLIQAASRLRPGTTNSVMAVAKEALRSMAKRCVALDNEIKALNARLDTLVNEANPALVATFGVGTEVAGALLVSAGDNPQRLRSEAATARLWGVAPIECSSGKSVRHRLSRAGDRQANAALYRIVLVRMSWDQTTKDYVERRLKEGKSKPEIIRCLKRYVAREIYTILKSDAHMAAQYAT